MLFSYKVQGSLFSNHIVTTRGEQVSPPPRDILTGCWQCCRKCWYASSGVQPVRFREINITSCSVGLNSLGKIHIHTELCLNSQGWILMKRVELLLGVVRSLIDTQHNQCNCTIAQLENNRENTNNLYVADMLLGVDQNRTELIPLNYSACPQYLVPIDHCLNWSGHYVKIQKNSTKPQTTNFECVFWYWYHHSTAVLCCAWDCFGYRHTVHPRRIITGVLSTISTAMYMGNETNWLWSLSSELELHNH